MTDSECPPDPFETGDSLTDAMDDGDRFYAALKDCPTVTSLLYAITALSEDELRWIIFARLRHDGDSRAERV